MSSLVLIFDILRDGVGSKTDMELADYSQDWLVKCDDWGWVRLERVMEWWVVLIAAGGGGGHGD